ncbi:MAG: hypothetical protein ACRD25_07875 [Terracidiphilus sp.]
MKTITRSNELGTRARDAITAVLRQASTIELKEIEERVTPDLSRQTEFIVRVCVLGHNKTLACKVTPSGESRAVRKALREFEDDAARFPGNAMPVIVAPYLPPESRDLCIGSNTGFVDFEDNARMILGGMFIAKRSLPRREHHAEALPEVVPARKFAPVRVVLTTADCGLPAVSAA